MTDKKKLELISGYVQKCYHESYYDMSNAIADIANILESETINPVPSIPIVGGGSVASDRTEPGGSGQSAEDVESIFYKRCDIARCDGASIEYLTKPNAIKAMHTYASHVCADKEREIAGLNNVISTMYAKSVDDSRVTMQIQSELDKANESLAVMLRKNDELLKSVRPEVVVPSEEWINGFKEEGRVASNWTIDKIKSLNPTLTFTELNHEK